MNIAKFCDMLPTTNINYQINFYSSISQLLLYLSSQKLRLMELFQIDKILVEEVSNVKFLMEEKVSRRETKLVTA